MCVTSYLQMTAVNAGPESNLQSGMDLFSTACKNFGLTISTKKPEVLFQPAPSKLMLSPT